MRAQKVGLVLSGGGASGLAHIGVLKALEENNIPIDYITGTSIGALVGALYSSGLSPEEIEQLIKSENFNRYVNGIIEDKHLYYFKQKDPNSSWITLRFSSGAIVQSSLPTNLISTVPLDLGLMELLSGPTAVANNNFDSLFIPFRCIASDIANKKQIVFSSGNLNEAVRASITYPFYIKPIIVDGKLLFDGGLYNNFPSDIMYNDFYPDIIIGSNVSGNFPLPEEDDILSQIKNMVSNTSNYSTLCENGIMIESHSDLSPFDFDNPQEIINKGYNSALLKIKEIKTQLVYTPDHLSIVEKRKEFRKRIPELNFGNILIDGLNKKQAHYIRQLLSHKQKQISFSNLKPEYYRLISDDKIKNIFPLAEYNPQSGNYNLILKIKKEREIITQFGGNISNKPINQGFLGLQYNYLGKNALTLNANTYFGKLYGSIQLKARIDFPNKIPFYMDAAYTLNRWDFFKSSSAFFEDVKPSYLIQKENYGTLNIGLPVYNTSKLNASFTFGNLENNYYQTRKFSVADTSDETNFNFISFGLSFEKNSLNRKQYASEGSYLCFKSRYIKGEEYTTPGSTAINERPFRGIHQWNTFNLTSEIYLKSSKYYRPGLFAEAVYSTQPFFHNYTASVLASPAFSPISESKTLFLDNFRAAKYTAVGIKNIFCFPKNIDFRLEGYVFQPLREIIKNQNYEPNLGTILKIRYFIASSSLVYHSPVGPLALNINYYQKQIQPISIMLHFGYLIFNKRALD